MFLKVISKTFFYKFSEYFIFPVDVHTHFLLSGRLLDFLDGPHFVNAYINGLCHFAKATLADYLDRLKILHDEVIGFVTIEHCLVCGLSLLNQLLLFNHFINNWCFDSGLLGDLMRV